MESPVFSKTALPGICGDAKSLFQEGTFSPGRTDSLSVGSIFFCHGCCWLEASVFRRCRGLRGAVYLVLSCCSEELGDVLRVFCAWWGRGICCLASYATRSDGACLLVAPWIFLAFCCCCRQAVGSPIPSQKLAPHVPVSRPVIVLVFRLLFNIHA